MKQTRTAACRRTAAACLLILAAFFLTGCWDRRELSEISIILGIGIDRTPEGEIKVTVQVAKPQDLAVSTQAGAGGGGGKKPTLVLSATGKTISDAMSRLEPALPRRPYFGHAIAVIFGQAAAKHGVTEYTNFISRTKDARETMWVAVTSGEAADILKAHSEMEKSSMHSLGHQALIKGGFKANFHEFLSALAAGESSPVASRVELVRQGVPVGPGVEKEPEEKHDEVAITGFAAFRGDRLAGCLEERESTGLLWLREGIQGGTITVPSPSEPAAYLSIHLNHGKAKVEPFYRDGTISFRVRIDAEGELFEQQDHANFLHPEALSALNAAAADEIKRIVSAALAKAQQDLRIDVMRFGESFHQKYKEAWRTLKADWNNSVADAPVSISVHFHVRRTGLQGGRAAAKKQESR